MTLAIGIFEPILRKLDILAILDDGLAGNKDVESGLECIMDSQLMAIQIECTSLALIDKDC